MHSGDCFLLLILHNVEVYIFPPEKFGKFYVRHLELWSQDQCFWLLSMLLPAPLAYYSCAIHDGRGASCLWRLEI